MRTFLNSAPKLWNTGNGWRADKGEYPTALSSMRFTRMFITECGSGRAGSSGLKFDQSQVACSRLNFHAVSELSRFDQMKRRFQMAISLLYETILKPIRVYAVQLWGTTSRLKYGNATKISKQIPQSRCQRLDTSLMPYVRDEIKTQTARDTSIGWRNFLTYSRLISWKKSKRQAD